jgi:hypothetical protein
LVKEEARKLGSEVWQTALINIFLPAMKLATKTPGHKVTQKVLL